MVLYLQEVTKLVLRLEKEAEVRCCLANGRHYMRGTVKMAEPRHLRPRRIVLGGLFMILDYFWVI